MAYGQGSGQLADQVAVITGASRGIGLATAEALVVEGAKVVLAARGAEALESAARAIRERGGEAIAVPADASQAEDVKRLMAAALERYNRLDILVNNAGMSGSNKPVVETDEDVWQKVQDNNLKSTFLCCRAALPIMLRAGYGRIVNISSRVGLAGYVLARQPGEPALADYAVAKAGVIALTKALAFEVSPHGITVNVITPGPIATEMLGARTEAELARRAAGTLVGRIGQPREVAQAVLFLVRPDSGFITGEVLNVNGGAWMG